MIIPILLILLFVILIIAAFMSTDSDGSGAYLFAAFLMLLPLVISIMIHTSQLSILH